MIAETFWQDLRIGLRVLIKEKAFCALAVFVLAIGIAAVTTQYAVVNGVLLRGFNFRHADRLVDVLIVDPVNFSPDQFNARMTTADFVDLKQQQTTFEEFVGYLNSSTINVTYNGQPYRFQGGYVNHDFFRILGIAPVLGRDFLPEEDRPNVEKAVILSDGLWRTLFGADPAIIGKSVRVNGRAGTVVGVMPPKFQFPQNEQLWVPLNSDFGPKPRSDNNVSFVSVIARLKPGVSLDQAEADISRIAKSLSEAYPDSNRPFSRGYVRPLIAAFTGGGLNANLYAMLAFCVGVLLIACVNVMNMQFARATLRARELAIRSSLGATRGRLIRQMLSESLLLAAIGSAFGIGIAFWATDFLNRYVHDASTNPIPSWMTFDIDVPVLAVVVGSTVLAAIVSGLVPALLSSRANANDTLKESGRGNTSRSVNLITKGLVVFQIFTTCILLLGAALQVQSIIRQQSIDYGYDTDGILAVRLGLMEGDYPTAERRQVFYEKLLRELRGSPEFKAAALTNRFRMVFSGNGPIEIEGVKYSTDSDRLPAEIENVTPGFHAVLGQRLLEGRELTDNDAEQKLPVAVVNATFASKHFPGQSAIGRRFRTTNQNGAQPGPWRVIVGVVSDVRMANPFDNRANGIGYYIPFFDSAFGPAPATPQPAQFGSVIVRPPDGQRPEALIPAVQNVIKKIDPNLPIYFPGTPRAAIDSLLSQVRLGAVMFAVFGVIAVTLASVGLYGVMSFAVNQRRQEFGVRMALGADASRILRMVLSQGAWQLAVGLGLGLLVSLAIATYFHAGLTGQNGFFHTSPRDPLSYVGVSLLIVVVSLIAILIPARRATRVDPMIALRAE